MNRFFVVFVFFCAILTVSCGSSSQKGSGDFENTIDDSDNLSEQTNDNTDTSSEQNDDNIDAEPTNDSDSCDTDNNDSDFSDHPDSAEEGEDTDSSDIEVGTTRVRDCENLPENADWNSVSAIKQTWNGSEWTPAEKGVYNTDSSETECRFRCNSNYTWKESVLQCEADTQYGTCPAKPANTQWNDDGMEGGYLQTWDGTEWSPSDVASEYSETAGICSYKCDTDHFWFDSNANGVFEADEECINPCKNDPCGKIEESVPGSCVSTSWNNYRCKCNAGRYWWGAENGCLEKPVSPANICTGQTLCYDYGKAIPCPESPADDFYGQDAQYTSRCAAQSFSSSSDVVVDNNTGLIWQKSPSTETYTWYDANSDDENAPCVRLNKENYGGINTWRVPNPMELLTIVDNGTYNPATDSNFTGMTSQDEDTWWYLWTSKEYKGNTDYAYGFGSYSGESWYEVEKTDKQKVLCVSGNELVPAGSGDFETSPDGKTVTDKRTGLIWQKEYVRKKWQDAFEYCRSLNDDNYGGYSTGWRLPNKNELVSLYDLDKPAPPYSNFPDMPVYWFWSSTTGIDSMSTAWLISFDNGRVDHIYKKNNYGVKCVRYQ